MLQEIATNTLPSRAAAAAGMASEKPAGKTQSLLLAASAQRLPSSDDEEDLEDYSSHDEEEDKPSATQPAQHLRRLVRGGQGSEVKPSEHLEDVMDGLAMLGLGARNAVSRGTSQSKFQDSSARPTTPPTSAEDDDSSSEDHDSSDSGSDNEPFFERIVRPIGTAATSSKGSATPEPGALVLGDQKQYVLPAGIARKLYPHQVEGVKWLWSLQAMQRGGILGDDMGLGKTMQCSAFLAGLFNSNLVRRVIIIAPKTLLPHWLNELAVCGLRSLTREYFGGSESARTDALRSVMSGRGIIVTTYGMVQHNTEQLAKARRTGDVFSWDLMLLDEGHKIKNPKMKLVEQLRQLPVNVRLIISGTPIQNHLMEMHALFDFTTEGLLHDAKTFKKNYEKPVTKGLDKEASERERQVGAAIAAELRKRIEPFFLRREKKDVLPDNSGGKDEAAAGSLGSGPRASSASGGQVIGQQARGLPRKNDLVVWLRLTALQRKIYTAFLQSDGVRAVLNEKASPLASITVLKKICDHPALLTQRAAQSAISGAHRWAKGEKLSGQRHTGGGGRRRRDSLDDFIVDDDEEVEEESADDRSESCGGSDSGGDGEPPRRRDSSGAEEPPLEWLGDGASLDTELTRELERRGADASCKTAFVLALLERLHTEGHRTLIFSQSKVMLNILEAGVKAMKLSYCRIDGDMATAEERQTEVQRFQRSSTIPVFLLTSQVGGLGLTLTAADRVIIVDPAWNPSVDNQSVDRAYRLGQTRDVVIYRLITCGTVEEKIYRKQVFKGGLSKTGTEEGIQFRYFTQMDLKDLFQITPEGLQQSATQVQLNEMHAHQRKATEELERHLESVLTMESVAGIHDHNLLFTQRPEERAPTAQEGEAILSQMSGAGLVGVDALTDMLGSGLRLGSSANTKREAVVETAVRKVEDLAGQLESAKLTYALQGKKLPDGGAKLRMRVEMLERQHQDAAAQLDALLTAEASGSGASASTSSQGTGKDATAVTLASGGHSTGLPSSQGSLPLSIGRHDPTVKAEPGQPQPPARLVRPGGFGAGPAARASAAASAGAGATGDRSGANPFAQFAAVVQQPPGPPSQQRQLPAALQRQASGSAVPLPGAPGFQARSQGTAAGGSTSALQRTLPGGAAPGGGGPGGMNTPRATPVALDLKESSSFLRAGSRGNVDDTVEADVIDLTDTP